MVDLVAWRRLSASPLLYCANRLRDRRFWRPAAGFYGAYLTANPDDQPVWLQAGHCLREAAQPRRAARAYERALYLDASDREAADYLNLVDQAVTAPDINQAGRLPRIFLEITDLILYLRSDRRINGIQRVLLNLVMQAQSAPAEVVFCGRFGRARQFQELGSDELASLVRSAISESARERLAALAACRNGRPIEFASGDTLLILGAFWSSLPYGHGLEILRQRGVAVGLLVYDLIPITHPQFVPRLATQVFTARLNAILPDCSFVITISDFVAGQVRKYIADKQLRISAIRPAPLPHQFGQLSSSTMGAEKSSKLTARLGGRPYVLCVGTLEPRKNQLYLVNIWRRLQAELGEDLPTLVLVGRWGWGSKPLSRDLAAEKAVSMRVMVITDASDSDLGWLYDNCLFTVAPSLVEGWGLPVGEALAHGKPCLAANSSSLQEVGGAFARYFDPSAPEDGFAMLHSLLTSRGEIEAWTHQVRDYFQPCQWAEYFANLCATTRDLRDKAALTAPTLSLAHGECIALGHAASKDAARVFRFGWGDLTSWGRWSANRVSQLEFKVGEAERGDLVRVGLALQLPTPHARASILIRSGDRTITLYPQSHDRRWHIIEVLADASGLVRITLEVQGFVPQASLPAPRFLGLSGICVTLGEDLEARFQMLEALCD